MLLTLLLLACSGEADDPKDRPAPVDPTAETGTTTTDTDTDTPTTSDTGPSNTGPRPALQFVGDAPKNVLMISIDTFRRDHMDAYGDLGLTPFMGALAEQGVVAANHQQCSNWTWHSTSCTLNGRYAVDIDHFPSLNGAKTPLPDVRSLATILSTEHDYGTVLVSNNAWLGPRWNNAQGYLVVNPRGGPLAVDIVRRATGAIPEALGAAQGTNWLAHAHMLEPHAPYIAPAEYVQGIEALPPLPDGVDLTKQPGHYAAVNSFANMPPEDVDIILAHMRLLYQAEVRWVDDQLETAWNELDDDGVLDDTLVVFWSDHGEAFMEHGHQTHAHDLYNAENQGILFFWAKNIVPARWTEPTHSIDLVPTILHTLGLPIDADMPGVPMGLADPHRVRFTSSHGRQGLQVAALKDDYKLLYLDDEPSYALYDMVVDPEESLNLLETDPDHAVAAELQPLIDERVERIRPLLQALIQPQPAP